MATRHAHRQIIYWVAAMAVRMRKTRDCLVCLLLSILWCRGNHYWSIACFVWVWFVVIWIFCFTWLMIPSARNCQQYYRHAQLSCYDCYSFQNLRSRRRKGYWRADKWALSANGERDFLINTFHAGLPSSETLVRNEVNRKKSAAQLKFTRTGEKAPILRDLFRLARLTPWVSEDSRLQFSDP